MKLVDTENLPISWSNRRIFDLNCLLKYYFGVIGFFLDWIVFVRLQLDCVYSIPF